MSISIDKELFFKRASILFENWKKGREQPEWGNSDAIVLLFGNSEEFETYQTGNALQIWLLGYEFSNTIICIISNAILIYTGEREMKYLQPLTGNRDVPVKLFKRTKNEEENKKTIMDVAKEISSSYSGSKLGVLNEESNQGKIADLWKYFLDNYSLPIEQVKVNPGIESILCVKDENEREIITQVSDLCDATMRWYFMHDILRYIDEEIPITHAKLSEFIDHALLEQTHQMRNKLPKGIDYNLLDWVYQPTIQSGGNYDLRVAVPSDNEKLKEDVIICSFALRYKAYCAQLSRTYFINPDKEQESNYEFLLNLQEYVVSILKDGAVCSKIYQSAVEYAEKHRPDLKQYLMRNMGWSMGIEFREPWILSPKCHNQVKTGMVFSLTIGLHKIKIKSESETNTNGVYSLLISDTVVVGKKDEDNIFLTKAEKNLESITFVLDRSEKKKTYHTPHGAENTWANESGISRLRGDRGRRVATLNKEIIMERQENQKRLRKLLRENGLKRFEKDEALSKGEKSQELKDFESYKSEVQLSERDRLDLIVLDKKRETVILPIHDIPCPFHIFTIKNVSVTDEQNYSYLKINFIIPTEKRPNDFNTSQDTHFAYVKSLTFKSSNLDYFSKISREINDFKKIVTKRELEIKEKADLVQQTKLIEIRSGKLITLPNVSVRPSSEKKNQGHAEIHENGVRYVHNNKNVTPIDILFDNVKHIFVQKCDNELIVLIHFNLNHPIIIGNKKTSDIQFYRDVLDSSYDDTVARKGGRAHYKDEDDIEIEMEERRHRKELNEEFLKFGRAIQDASGIVTEVPHQSQGFMGISGRQMLSYHVTNSCLVYLSDLPFLVITLNEVELVHLERIQYGLKNFDMVFVFKDFNRPVVHINSIPVTKLESVKCWFDKVDIPFSEGPANLSWPAIMKTINQKPRSFFKNGGWSFLMPSDDEEEEEEKSEDSGEDFEPESDELKEAEYSSEEYSSEAESEIEEEEEEEEEEEDEYSDEEYESSEDEDDS